MSDNSRYLENQLGAEIDKQTGAFHRQQNLFTAPFGEGEGRLPVEAGRYRLIVSPVCPWAHRQRIVLALLGLDEVISTGVTYPIRTERGWIFSDYEGGVDPVLGVESLDDVYLATDPDYKGRATVPAVIDLKTGKVVNNDYHRLSNYFEVEWKRFHKPDAPDLYPEELREDIDALNEIIFNEVNNGVYKAGFARSQQAYEEAYDTLFARLDWLEERLSHSRYLFGDRLTDADIRLWVTLVRFDAAYNLQFKVNRNKLIDFPNLWNYAKELYQIPAFKNTTSFDGIRRGYLLNPSRNTFGILAKGPDLSVWEQPHDREREYAG